MKRILFISAGTLLFCIILGATSSLKSNNLQSKDIQIFITKCQDNTLNHKQGCPREIKTNPKTGELFLRKIRNNRKAIA